MAVLPDLWIGVDPDIQATIRAICGWHIAPVITETVTLDGSGSAVQLFPTLALRRIISLSNAGTPVDLVANPLQISRRGMVRGLRWTDQYSGVVAEIEHGFDAAPADLRTAATRIATLDKLFASGGGSVRIGQVQVSPGTSAGMMTVDYDGLDHRTQSLLAPYMLNWGA